MNRRRALATIAILAILGVTLAPYGAKPPAAFSWCVACGRRGLADAILNLWLFVPLGLVLGWKSRRPRAVILFAFFLATAVELVQTIIPGRDPSLSDIIFNTAGASLGVLLARKPKLWLFPRETISPVFALIGTAVIGLVMVATAVLLSPANQAFSVAPSGDDLVLRYTTRASSIGLDEPEYRLRGAALGSTGSNATIRVLRERARWLIDLGIASPARLGPTVGQGWTLLAYPDAIGRRWGVVLDALWIAAICLPVGYWARGPWLGVAGAAVAVLLILIPAATGVLETSGAEWAGAAAGIVCGATIASLFYRLMRRWEISASGRPR